MLHQDAQQASTVGVKEALPVDATRQQHENPASRFEAIRTCASALFQQQTRDLTKTAEMTRTVHAQTQVENELKLRHRALQQMIASMEARKQMVAEQIKERTELLRSLDQEVSGVAESQQKLQHCLSRADSVAQAVERFVHQFSTAPDAWPPAFLAEAHAITRGVSVGDFRSAATEMRRLKCAAELVERQLASGHKPPCAIAAEDDEEEKCDADGQGASAAERLARARGAVDLLCEAITGAVNPLRCALGRPGGDSSVAALLEERGTLSRLDSLFDTLRSSRAMGVDATNSSDSTTATAERLEQAVGQLHNLLRSPKPLESEWRCGCEATLEALAIICAARREDVRQCAPEGSESVAPGGSDTASAALADSEMALRNLWSEYEALAEQLAVALREHADSVDMAEASRTECDLAERSLNAVERLLCEATKRRDRGAAAVIEAQQKVLQQRAEVMGLSSTLAHSQEALRLLDSDWGTTSERASRTLDDAWDDYCSRVEVVRKLSFDVATEEQHGAAQSEASNALEREVTKAQGIVSAVGTHSSTMKAEIDGALCVLSAAVSQQQRDAADDSNARVSLAQMVAAVQSLSRFADVTHAASKLPSGTVHDAVGTVRQHVLAGAVSSLCCDGVAPLITDPELRTRLAAGIQVARSTRQIGDDALERARKAGASVADRNRRLEELVQCQ